MKTPDEQIEGLREKFLTLGVCIGPYDSPHRCSALHCDHCGLCDVSEEVLAIIHQERDRAVLEAIGEDESKVGVNYNSRTWSYLTDRNQLRAEIRGRLRGKNG